jgi:FlaA1/EpsC-like NDP-sugar epimerase
VIPLFHEQITNGQQVTITTPDMTRFLISLNQAVDTIFAALRQANRGETYIPRIPSAKVVDIASALIGERPVKMIITGIRPGEKIHEILVSEEEAHRTVRRGDYNVILPILPELQGSDGMGPTIGREYSSADNLLSIDETKALLQAHGLMIGGGSAKGQGVELLR